MTLELVPVEDVVSKEMGGRRRLYRTREEKRKELEEKRRIARIRANDAFDEIEKWNKLRDKNTK